MTQFMSKHVAINISFNAVQSLVLTEVK